MPKHMLMKQKWWPQPHVIDGGISFEFDDATIDSTIIPIAFYDEALGAPSTKETNPENAAFAIVQDEPNCFVGSRINSIFCEFRFTVTKDFLEDSIPNLRMAIMPIYCAFSEDYTAADELSGETVATTLELQTESTDRQGGPLYVAGTDMPEKTANVGLMGVNVPFLNVDQGLEAVAFNHNNYYNAIQHQTHSGKVRACSGGLRWFNLNANRPFVKMRFGIVPKVKAMNPFTYYGMLLHAPPAGQGIQGPALAELTVATPYVHVDWAIRYNEWNPEFNFGMV